MFKRFHAALAAMILLAPASALAADNYQVKDGNGVIFTLKSKDTGAGQSPQFVPSDAFGAPIFVQTNPGVADTVVRSPSADRGGTITAGGTAQQFMAANTARRGVIYQNQSTGDLYVNCLAIAAPNQTSLKIPAGALYESNPHHSGTGACSIYGATTGQAFYAREF